MNKFIVVCYYTLNTLYEEEVKRLKTSLDRYSIPYHIEGIVNLGDWWKNTQFKPTFIKQMMLKFPEQNIVYIDCDAEFKSFPKLFEKLDCNIAAYEFDRKIYGNSKVNGLEILSGTLFFKNCDESLKIINRWEKECQSNLHKWDQKSLAKIIGQDFYKLPAEYCTIFDTMKYVQNPVIVHYQASRRARKILGVPEPFPKASD